MTTRVNPMTHLPLVKPLIEYARAVEAMGLEPSLLELVRIRASQINGCAVCLHMHTTEAKRRGESEERLMLLNAWHECPFYSAREKAALAWTEALTRLSETRAPDEDYETMRAQFNEEEAIKLTLVIGAINAHNRIGAGFRVPPLTQQMQQQALQQIQATA
jgi:AhpD family alkylhydroperoxidase